MIIGDGPEQKNLEKLAGKNIEFKGFVEEHTKINLLKGAKGFVFAGDEDFGIVLVEALAAGVPLIAYKKGGALEVISEGQNGVFFNQQNPGSIIEAVRSASNREFNAEKIIDSSKKFSAHNFRKEIERAIQQVMSS
jgi:glycosyltransferase involved in cell wall biosynthesis